LFGVTQERVRQLEHHAAWMLVRTWRPQVSPIGSTVTSAWLRSRRFSALPSHRYPLEDDAERS
jgi:hypothetical protein